MSILKSDKPYFNSALIIDENLPDLCGISDFLFAQKQILDI